MFPNSQRINRGGLVLTELVETCRNHGFTDVVILHEHRGEPGESDTHTSTRGPSSPVFTLIPPDYTHRAASSCAGLYVVHCGCTVGITDSPRP